MLDKNILVMQEKNVYSMKLNISEITHIFYIAALHNMGDAKKQFGQRFM